jgi:hypothetical protein
LFGFPDDSVGLCLRLKEQLQMRGEVFADVASQKHYNDLLLGFNASTYEAFFSEQLLNQVRSILAEKRQERMERLIIMIAKSFYKECSGAIYEAGLGPDSPLSSWQSLVFTQLKRVLDAPAYAEICSYLHDPERMYLLKGLCALPDAPRMLKALGAQFALCALPDGAGAAAAPALTL